MGKRVLFFIFSLGVLLMFMPTTLSATDFSEYIALSSADDLSDGLREGKYYLKNNITVSKTIEVYGEVTLDLNGKTLSIGSNQSVFYLFGCSLDLYDTSSSRSGTIIGGSISSEGGGGCLYGSLYTFNMYGGTIKDCSTNKENSAGAILVGVLATFNMYDGTIKSCSTSANYSAGGVLVANTGTFNMYGGVIQNCSTTANYSAGGVYVSKEDDTVKCGTFNMSNGTIKSCYAYAPKNDLYCLGCVGGVYNGGKFDMTGGKIELCALYGFKGAEEPVYGCALHNKHSSDSCNAAGVYNDEEGVFTIKSGTLSNSTAQLYEGDKSGKSQYVDLGNSGTVYAHGGVVYGAFQFGKGIITKKQLQCPKLNLNNQ